jgi:uncharacterized protein YgfB (UPF0149 family)
VTSDPPITSQDYEELRKSLTDSGALLALPELHGGVSGALCAGGPPAAARWVDEFFADHEVTHVPAVQDAVLDLVRATWQMLAGGELAFEPLLPDDDTPLEEQVQALALWCHGFLNGLGASAPDLVLRIAARGGKRAARAVPAAAGAAEVSAEVTEILGDFGEISRAGVDEEDAADRDTADFALAELKEYARVSTQIVFESLVERRAVAARDVH